MASLLAEHLQQFAAAKETLTPSQQKVDSHLRRLAWPGEGEAQALALPLIPPPWQQGAWLHVYVQLHATAQEALDSLSQRGLAIERVNHDFAIAQGWVTPVDLPGVADLDVVASITPVLPGYSQIGAVTTEGDATSRANLVRAQGYDGTGVTVGVISDGINSVASAQATGDLGPVTVPPGCQAGSGDEGTAMLEIVHDLAPGAPLLFSSGAGGSLDFINSVNCLRAAGAKIIVDDEGFFDQPFFQDGPVASTVRGAVQGGVSYFTAAGNSALQHIEQPYCPGPGGFHDFACGSGATGLDPIIQPGTTLVCVLQWNDPFGASANDYDLLAVDAVSGTLLAVSDNVQNGTQNPFEAITLTNPLAFAVPILVGIGRASGQSRLLDLFCFERDGPAQSFSLVDTPGGSIFGHAAVPEVVTVGAIDVKSPGLATVEPFSSQGPVAIFFPAFETRAKPDLAGFDDVSTTLPPPFSPFFGTSAAAPHVAAAAALLLSKDPFLTPSKIKSTLMSTAVDIGAPGYDYVAGAGRLDAFAAANAVGVILIPGGGNAKSDCYVVAAVEGTHALKNAKTLECADGDPTCDMDGVCNNVCALTVSLCINSPKFSPCMPPSQLQSLQFKSHPATFTVNTPAQLTGSQCGAPRDLNLPVKVNKKGKKSTGVVMATATAKAPKGTKPPKDSDTYVLKCVPGCTP